MTRDHASPAVADDGDGRGGWRLILGDGGGLAPADGPFNMGMDVALLEAVRLGAAPVVRFYRWSPACLSFGRNQPARGLYDLAAAVSRGIDFVRRPTGGQAVLHADELTYAVIAPVSRIGRPRDAYRQINGALVAGLRSLGVDAELAQAPALAAAPTAAPAATSTAAPAATSTAGPAANAPGGPAVTPRSTPEWRMACFRRPEAGEVVASGRKLVGSAQRMEGRVILQHGSLLLGGSQAAAEELLLEDAGNPDPAAVHPLTGWTTLDTELGDRPPLHELASALAAGFERALGTSLAPATITDSEATDARRLKERFGSEAWIWRR
jgi:lipoyl(octanoyl) transferase